MNSRVHVGILVTTHGPWEATAHREGQGGQIPSSFYIRWKNVDG